MVGNHYIINMGVSCTCICPPRRCSVHSYWLVCNGNVSLSLSITASMAEHQLHARMKSAMATVMVGWSPTEERLTMLFMCPK